MPAPASVASLLFATSIGLRAADMSMSKASNSARGLTGLIFSRELVDHFVGLLGNVSAAPLRSVHNLFDGKHR